MAQYFEVHPDNPQQRLLKQAAALLHRGGVAAVPTDSSYALVCHLDDKDAADKLRRIRQVDDKHHLTLLCRDLSELSSYARVDNRQYRLLKQATPGAYTFILEASKEVPRRLSHPQRKTIGLRVPDHKVLQELLAVHGAPLLATTLIPAGETEPLNDAADIRERYESALAAVVDAGACPLEPTTVIDLTGMGTGGSDSFNYFDWEDFKFAIMPIIAFALPPLAIMTRTTRSSLSEVLNQDFIQTLRAKGLSEFSIILHAIRNIMPAAIAMLGLQLGYLIGGSVLVETVFTWPGTGFLLNKAILARDIPLLQGTILLLATVFVLINLVVDLVQSLVDPRIKRI